MNSNGKSNTLGNNKILIGVVIALILIVAVIGTYAVVTTLNNDSNDNNDSDSAVDSSIGTDLDTNNVDTASVTSSSIPLSEVRGLAQKYLDSSMPSSLEYQGVTFTKPQCLYIFAKYIDMKNTGTDGDIKFKSFKSPDKPSIGQLDSREYFTKSEYVDMAQRTISWMDNHGRAPNYIGVWTAGSNDVGYNRLVWLFASIITDPNISL